MCFLCSLVTVFGAYHQERAKMWGYFVFQHQRTGSKLICTLRYPDEKKNQRKMDTLEVFFNFHIRQQAAQTLSSSLQNFYALTSLTERRNAFAVQYNSLKCIQPWSSCNINVIRVQPCDCLLSERGVMNLMHLQTKLSYFLCFLLTPV